MNKEKVKILICRKKTRTRRVKRISTGKVGGVDESFAGHEVVARLLSFSLPPAVNLKLPRNDVLQ